MSKKHKKGRGRRGQGMQGGSEQGGARPMHQGQYAQYGMGMTDDAMAGGMYGVDAGFAQGRGAAAQAPGLQAGLNAAGLLQGMPAFLRTRNTEQFLLGALIGAAAAWVLSDEELRGKIVKSAMRLYAGVAGGFEEMKEQMSDIRAEVEAERHGDA